MIAAVFLQWQMNRVTPPLQAPDEFNHFFRAWQIADGQWATLQQDKRLGGYVPDCVREFVLPYSNAATNLKYVLTKDDLVRSYTIPYRNRDSVFYDYPNTALYSALSYAPQALAISVLKRVGASMADIYYGGRYAIFCCWLIAMFFVIRMIPFGKWLVTFLLLLPMHVYIVNSYSADAVTDILSLLFIAYVLKLSFTGTDPLSKKHLFWLSVLLIGLSFAKVVYIGLAILLLLIPKHKFTTNKEYVKFQIVLLAVTLLSTFLSSKVVMMNYLPYELYNPGHRENIILSNCANYDKQKEYILSHGMYFLEVIYRSIFDHPITYLNGYIGIFGNSDIFLTRDLVYLSYALIFLIALTEFNAVNVSIKQRFILLLSGFAAFVLLLLSQHLTWDCVGEGIVDFVQGRYLIPILPAMFLSLSNARVGYRFLPPLVVIVFVFIIHNYSCNAIEKRFYEPTQYYKNEFYCGAESQNEWGYFKTSQKYLEINGNKCQTSETARTGKYSAELSKKHQYCYEYKFKGLQYGDVIHISCWQKGNGAQIVLTGKGKNCKEIYSPTNFVHYRDSKGWGYMQFIHTFSKKCDSTEFMVFVWNPDTTKKVFVDDFHFKLWKYNDNYLDSVFFK